MRLGVGIRKVIRNETKRKFAVAIASHADVLISNHLERYGGFACHLGRDAVVPRQGRKLDAVDTCADEKVGAARLSNHLVELSHDTRAIGHVLEGVLVITLVPYGTQKAIE